MIGLNFPPYKLYNDMGKNWNLPVWFLKMFSLKKLVYLGTRRSTTLFVIACSILYKFTKIVSAYIRTDRMEIHMPCPSASLLNQQRQDLQLLWIHLPCKFINNLNSQKVDTSIILLEHLTTNPYFCLHVLKKNTV